MAPVTNKNYVLFDLNKKCENENEVFRFQLLKNQLR